MRVSVDGVKCIETCKLWIGWVRMGLWTEKSDQIDYGLESWTPQSYSCMYKCVIIAAVWQRVRCQWRLTWLRRPSSRCQLHSCTVHQTVPTAACQTEEAVTVSSVHSVYCPTPAQLLQPLTLIPVQLGVTGARVTSRCLATSTMTRWCGPLWRHPADELRFPAQVGSD